MLQLLQAEYGFWKEFRHHLLHSSNFTSSLIQIPRYYGFIKAVDNDREHVCSCQGNIDEYQVIKQKGSVPIVELQKIISGKKIIGED
ncbi:hypothetical protein AVEN_86145-1 [Araneus ventricosus]|uniref:Uncharacterized protein n=1 Tax=Araneus ventricosus TaxID=182803 RepID=A0A4Y2P3K5_ARAVE|nr:hypothetical protein AVEN_86145-1 [Araneus ventricosus]